MPADYGHPHTHDVTSVARRVLNRSRATNEERLTLDQIWSGSVQCAGSEELYVAATFASSSTALLL